MKKAWIENGKIRDVIDGNPSELFHSSVAVNYSSDVPDNAANGDAWDGATLTKPVASVVVTQAAIPPKVDPIKFKLLFTSAERVALTALRATDPIVNDYFTLLDDLRLTEVDLSLASTQASLDYLTLIGAIAAGRKDEILTGVIQ